MQTINRLAVPAAFAALLSTAIAATTAHAGDPVPHRAIYELKLGAEKGMSRFTGVTGAVTRSVEKTCDGWIVAEHLIMRIATRVGGVIDREVRFTSWESNDATSYRFAVHTTSKAGNEDTRFQGTLKVPREGAAGVVTYTQPQGRTVKVPEGTHLPISHVRKLTAEAAKGTKQVRFYVFDGSEEKGPDIMSSFILDLDPEKPLAGASSGKDLGPLAQGPGWRINAAFFEIGATDAAPTFQIDMELLANGVPRNMVLDLADFTIIQSLKEVEALPPPKC
ncbi:MAG: DUF1849 family protein [Rhodospirillaceae bacterium]